MPWATWQMLLWFNILVDGCIHLNVNHKLVPSFQVSYVSFTFFISWSHTNVFPYCFIQNLCWLQNSPCKNLGAHNISKWTLSSISNVTSWTNRGSKQTLGIMQLQLGTQASFIASFHTSYYSFICVFYNFSITIRVACCLQSLEIYCALRPTFRPFLNQ